MLINVLGVGVYFLIAGLIAMEVALFRREPVETPWLKSLGWFVALLGITTLGSQILPDWTISPLIGAGGYLGALSRGLLAGNVGTIGCLVGGIAMTVAGMMMWTEYLIFTAGRVAFSPAIVAATKLLPFGIVYEFMQWFNGDVEEEEYDEEEYEYEEEYDEDGDGEISEEERRTIRFRRRDRDEEVFDEVEIGGASVASATATLIAADEDTDPEAWEEELDAVVAATKTKTAEPEVEEEYEEDEYEEDEYEEQSDEEELPASLNIQDNTSKVPIPALAPATDEDEDDEILRVDEPAAKKSKPHFKMPAKKAEPSERDQMISQLGRCRFG